MNKNVIIIEAQGKVKTIITDGRGIRAVGVAVCHEGDTFDATIGEKISTIYAWKKYCAKKIKQSTREAAEWQDFSERAAKKSVRYLHDMEYNVNRIATLDEELAIVFAEVNEKAKID